MSSISTLATSCRACLKDSLESYFELSKQCYFAANDQNFGDIFNFCTQLQVQINEELPQRICVFCVHDLQTTYEFLQRVFESNNKLLNLKTEWNGAAKEVGDTKNGPTIDPLENVTDNEEDTTFNSENKTELMEINDEDGFSYTSFDNAHIAADDYQVNDTFISSFLSDSEDRSDDDFFTSVESLIFPQGRLECKICRKPYFTAAGLEAHMDLHLPKEKSTARNASTTGKYLKKARKLKSDISDEENSNNDHNVKITKVESKTKQPKPKKLYPCEVCGKQMISASKLRYHMVMHTGEKDYLCTMCPKAYSTIYALKHHMRAHTGERPYECKFCGDRFLRPTTLKSHMRRHTGERPYGCDICGKRFIQHSSMATHMKLNHMDKTIQCPYCDKKYARQTDLNTHLLSHSGDKPFACQLCPSRFTRQSNLNKHLNQQHSNALSGDKKLKYKAMHETSSITNAVQQPDNCNNDGDMAASCILENPACSSNLK